MEKRRNKRKSMALAWGLALFLLMQPPAAFPVPDGREGMGRLAVVLSVNDEEGFVFIDLGRDDVAIGDLLEIYKDSDRIATGSIRRTMRRMSEASISEKDRQVNIGDRVMVYGFPEDLPVAESAADAIAEKLKEKLRQLEKEDILKEKFETLEEAEELAEETFKAQRLLQKESGKKTVTRLEKKLSSLMEKKEEIEDTLGGKIASLKNAKETVERGIVPSVKKQSDTVAMLETKLNKLEMTKNRTMTELKREIENLVKKKNKIEPPVKPKTIVRKEKAKGFLNRLERKLKRKPREDVLPEEKPFLAGGKGGGLSMEECIAIATENHLPFKIAEKQLKLAKSRLIEAQRKFGPSVTAKWEETGGKVSGRYYDGRKIAFEVKQPLFYGGELIFSMEQAKVNMEIVKTDYDRIKNDLILQVKKAYYNLDKTGKALLIQEKLHEEAERIYDITEIAHEEGVIPEIEFLKVGSQYNQTSFQLASAGEDVAVADLILQQAMNAEGSVGIIPLNNPRIITLSLQDCFDLAYLNRPEMKINNLSLEHFEYEKKIMEARAHWPRIDLLGMYGNMREDFVSGDADDGRIPRQLGPEYYFGTKVSLPVWGNTLGYSFTKEKWQPVVRTVQETQSATHEMTFSILDRLEDFSLVQEAELEYMRSQDELSRKKQEITLEVKETFFKYKKSIFLMNVAQNKLKFQSKQVEIIDIRRELGEAQYSDVIEEMIKQAEEEFSRVQAISDYYVSIASLNRAVGINNHFQL